jgi:hypothetical protein
MAVAVSAEQETQSPRWPSAAVVSDVYGDWNSAVLEAGARVRLTRWDDDAIRAALAAFWTRRGRPPRTADLRHPVWPGPSAETLRRRFGGLRAAWEALGPVPA